jgi:hypothetical protein
VIFKPAAAGARAARLVFTSNTVANLNTVLLNGTGILPKAILAITSPAGGSSSKAGTSINLAASVTSASGPVPTGKVQFEVDGVSFGSPVTISSGTVSTSVTGLTTAGHTLGAIYLGDANYAQTGPVNVSVTVTAVKAAPGPVIGVMSLQAGPK